MQPTPRKAVIRNVLDTAEGSRRKSRASRSTLPRQGERRQQGYGASVARRSEMRPTETFKVALGSADQGEGHEVSDFCSLGVWPGAEGRTGGQRASRGRCATSGRRTLAQTQRCG